MKIKLVILAAYSGILISLAVPNELSHMGNPLTGFLCISPFLIAVSLSPSRGFSSILGMVFAALSSLLTYYWLLFFREFSVWTISGVTLGYIGYFALFSPFLFTFSKINPAYRPFVLAAAWTVYEYFKSSGYLGFPWGLVAYPVGGILPIIQIVDITGVWGLSFLMALVNSLIAEIFLQEGVMPITNMQISPSRSLLFRQFAVAGLLFLAVTVYGYTRLATPIPDTKSFSAVLVQQNIDTWLTGNELEGLATAERLSREGVESLGEKPDLLVWSETSLRRPYREFKAFYLKYPEEDPFIPFLREMDTHMFTGSPYVIDRGRGSMMNATILLDPDGELVDFYGKQHPVPLAEHIPFWDVPLVKKFFTEIIGLYSSGWTLGKRYTIFSIPLKDGDTISFGTPICFEDAFPYICRRFVLNGADILINLTNDAWSKTVSAETQHFVAARFRAVEMKRVLVRSTNAGVTAVIGPYGEILAELPLFTEAALAVEVPVYIEKEFTPYTVFGDYLPLIFMGILMAILFYLAGMFHYPSISKRHFIP